MIVRVNALKRIGKNKNDTFRKYKKNYACKCNGAYNMDIYKR